MPRILITGGTGLIGQKITERLQAQGMSVAVLSRRPDFVRKIPAYHWDVDAQTIDESCLEDTVAIIHLAGAGVADKRWTDDRKAEILHSRTRSTALLHKLLSDYPNEVKTLVSASAIGYYGNNGDEIKSEESSPGNDFLAEVTVAWENAANALENLDIRLVKIRIGVVLTMHGGALAKLAVPIQWWAGAPLGSGKQYMSWIHIDDLCGIFIYALKNEALSGSYNGVSPNPVTNKEFTREVARILNKPLILPNVPSFVLKGMLGEMASMVLGGTRVSSQKIEDAGYTFRFPDISAALIDLLH